jgi:hypothetical protein
VLAAPVGGLTPHAKEGHMKRIDWDAAIRSLVLVRLGQELGSDSPLARMIHDMISLSLTIIGVMP